MDFDIDDLEILESALETEVRAGGRNVAGTIALRRLLERVQAELQQQRDDEWEAKRDAALALKGDD